MELIERLETIASVQVGIQQMERGETQPAKEALEKIRQKHRILRAAQDLNTKL